jgi:hypothetical protein
MSKRKMLSRRQLLEAASITYLTTDIRKYRLKEWRTVQDLIIDGFIASANVLNPFTNQNERRYYATEKGKEYFTKLNTGV